MGYYVTLTAADFTVPTENLDAAYDAVCALNRRNDMKTGGSWPRDELQEGPHERIWFAWMPWNYPDVAHDLAEVMRMLGFEILVDDDGLHLTFYDDDKSGAEDVFLDALAPFVAPGSFLEWRGEDADSWRWEFDGEKMKVVVPRMQ